MDLNKLTGFIGMDAYGYSFHPKNIYRNGGQPLVHFPVPETSRRAFPPGNTVGYPLPLQFPNRQGSNYHDPEKCFATVF